MVNACLGEVSLAAGLAPLGGGAHALGGQADEPDRPPHDVPDHNSGNHLSRDTARGQTDHQTDNGTQGERDGLPGEDASKQEANVEVPKRLAPRPRDASTAHGGHPTTPCTLNLSAPVANRDGAAQAHFEVVVATDQTLEGAMG